MGRAEDRIRFHQHQTYVSQSLAGSVADLEQLLNLAKLGQQVGDIVDDLGIADTDLLGVMTADEFDEKFLQWMRFWNHFLSTLPNPPTTRLATTVV